MFELDGQPFYFAGANAYWIMNQTREWTEALFSNASAQGLSVLRTWFFHDGQFQTIVDGKQTFDDGPDGMSTSPPVRKSEMSPFI